MPRTPVIPGVFSFISVENDGIANGWLAGILPSWAIILITSILSIAAITAWVWLVLFRNSNKKMLANISFAFFVAGAVGNLYDRIAYKGIVRDFVDIEFLPWLGIFNFADLCLTVGTIMLGVYFVFFFEDKQTKVKKIEPNET